MPDVNPMISLNVDDVQEMELLPEGQAQLQVLNVKVKETSNGKTMLIIVLEPLDTEAMVEDIIDTLFLPSPDDTPKQANKAKLKMVEFAEACGVTIPADNFDPAELFQGATPWALVGQQPHYKTGLPCNVIKNYIVE